MEFEIFVTSIINQEAISSELIINKCDELLKKQVLMITNKGNNFKELFDKLKEFLSKYDGKNTEELLKTRNAKAIEEFSTLFNEHLTLFNAIKENLFCSFISAINLHIEELFRIYKGLFILRTMPDFILVTNNDNLQFLAALINKIRTELTLSLEQRRIMIVEMHTDFDSYRLIFNNVGDIVERNNNLNFIREFLETNKWNFLNNNYFCDQELSLSSKDINDDLIAHKIFNNLRVATESYYQNRLLSPLGQYNNNIQAKNNFQHLLNPDQLKTLTHNMHSVDFSVRGNLNDFLASDNEKSDNTDLTLEIVIKQCRNNIVPQLQFNNDFIIFELDFNYALFTQKIRILNSILKMFGSDAKDFQIVDRFSLDAENIINGFYRDHFEELYKIIILNNDNDSLDWCLEEAYISRFEATHLETLGNIEKHFEELCSVISDIEVRTRELDLVFFEKINNIQTYLNNVHRFLRNNSEYLNLLIGSNNFLNSKEFNNTVSNLNNFFNDKDTELFLNYQDFLLAKNSDYSFINGFFSLRYPIFNDIENFFITIRKVCFIDIAEIEFFLHLLSHKTTESNAAAFNDKKPENFTGKLTAYDKLNIDHNTNFALDFLFHNGEGDNISWIKDEIERIKKLLSADNGLSNLVEYNKIFSVLTNFKNMIRDNFEFYSELRNKLATEFLFYESYVDVIDKYIGHKETPLFALLSHAEDPAKKLEFALDVDGNSLDKIKEWLNNDFYKKITNFHLVMSNDGQIFLENITTHGQLAPDAYENILRLKNTIFPKNFEQLFKIIEENVIFPSENMISRNQFSVSHFNFDASDGFRRELDAFINQKNTDNSVPNDHIVRYNRKIDSLCNTFIAIRKFRQIKSVPLDNKQIQNANLQGEFAKKLADVKTLVSKVLMKSPIKTTYMSRLKEEVGKIIAYMESRDDKPINYCLTILKQLESDILSRYSGLISNFHQESLLCLKEQLLDSIILKNNWLTAELSKEGGSGAIDVEEFYGNKFHEIINNIIGYIKNEYEQLLWLSDYEKMELDNWLDGFRKYINDINGEINYLKNPGIAVDFSLCNKLNNQMDLIERIHSDIVHFSDFFDNLKRKIFITCSIFSFRCNYICFVVIFLIMIMLFGGRFVFG